MIPFAQRAVGQVGHEVDGPPPESTIRPGAPGQSAILLAAHGAGDGSPTNDLIRDLARRIRALHLFDSVTCAFHLGRPPFDTALDDIIADRVIVVPVMTADGYFCGDMLPRGLVANARIEEVDLTLTPPVGVHPAIVGIVLRRAENILSRFDLDPAETVLIVVGHGTRRIRQSIESTHTLRDAIRRHVQEQQQSEIRPGVPGLSPIRIAAVEAAFLDAEPGVEFIPETIPRRNLIVIPFLIGGGRHATHDLPVRLGLEPFPPGASCVTGRRGDRFIACTDPIGADPALLDIILDLAAAGRPGQALKTTQRESDYGHGLRSPSAPSEPRPSGSGQRSTARHPPPIRNPCCGAGFQPVAAPLRLGTRGSALAFWQARHVAEKLRARGYGIDIIEISTTGDRDRVRPIQQLGGAAPFADDIESALRNHEIDLAVHSLKDLSARPPDDLAIAAILRRGDARETLVSRNHLRLADLPPGARVGTSSPRRAAQVRLLRPDLHIAPIRGPVDDRVRQVRRGDYDAAILAAAGLQRLGLHGEIAEFFPLERFVPAPAQAALAVQARKDDADTIDLLAALDHAATRRAVTAELAFLRPFAAAGPAAAAHATVEDDVRLHARLLSSSGSILWEAVLAGDDPLVSAGNRFPHIFRTGAA